jgi:hypothetical protein
VIHNADVPFDDASVLSDYSAATGFKPDDPGSDKGTNVHDALSYRRHTGIVDADGARHQSGAYVSLDPKNWQHLEQATYIFGAVGIGIEFPDSAMQQFNAGEPWDVVNGAHIEEAGTIARRQLLLPQTGCPWSRGASAGSSRRTSTKYNDEAYAYIAPTGSKRRHRLAQFDIEKLNACLTAAQN